MSNNNDAVKKKSGGVVLDLLDRCQPVCAAGTVIATT